LFAKGRSQGAGVKLRVEFNKYENIKLFQMPELSCLPGPSICLCVWLTDKRPPSTENMLSRGWERGLVFYGGGGLLTFA